ncbi:MAG: glycosyltransferase [Pseudomonadota bacterium]
MLILAMLSVLIWLGLLLFWGGFWCADQRLGEGKAPAQWPEVVAVIPARDEAETIETVLSAHGKSQYPGKFSVIVVDDSSSDETGEIARGVQSTRAIHVLEAPEIEAGWTGKLWALQQGTKAIPDVAPGAAYVLLTDADILHGPETLANLVAKAEAEDLGLVSLMARLDRRGIWGRILIPAFVFFFQKLYPFPLVNDPAKKMAAAAGGCVLLKREALEAIGGIASIRTALIDDCALAGKVKGAGYPIWLGLAHQEVLSLRDNRALNAIWTMVARTAYTQLQYSPWLLAGSMMGMAVLYLAGPVTFGFGFVIESSAWVAAGAVAWALSAVAYWPTANLYRLMPVEALALPFAALLYMAMTLDSAWQHRQGTGGAWKGRTYPKK